MRRMQKKTEHEFEKLYEGCYEQLYRAAFRLTGSREDAEDIIQETYFNAYQAFERFEQKSAVGTWLYRIMLNCAYRHMKRVKKLPIQIIASEKGISESEFWESVKSNESVEESAIIDDIRETCIQLFLICMPRKQRVAFTLKVLMQLTSAEVAEIMDISESAVKVNVYRAKQHLKNNMEGRCSLINPKYPCQCANWYGYLIETGKISRIPAYRSIKERDRDLDLLFSEMDFLHQVKALYSRQPEPEAYEKFIRKIKSIISNGTLKIFA